MGRSQIGVAFGILWNRGRRPRKRGDPERPFGRSMNTRARTSQNSWRKRRLKDLVNEFAALGTSESVSWYTGYKRNNVWSGLKHSY